MVLSTAALRSDATRSAAYLSLDDDYGDEEDGGGDSSSSFSFTFPSETTSPELVFGLYNDKCPNAEDIVPSTVRKLYHADSNIAAARARPPLLPQLLHPRTSKQTNSKMHAAVFSNSDHGRASECAGLRPSVLLDRVAGEKSERDAGPNQSLRGLGAVEAIKWRVEAACPGTVSYADILACLVDCLAAITLS